MPINNVIRDYVPLVSKRVQGKLKKNTVAKKYPRHIQRAMRKNVTIGRYLGKIDQQKIKKVTVTKLLCVKR